MSITGNYSNPYSSYTSGLGSTSTAGSAGASDVKFSSYTPSSGNAGGEQKSGGIGGFFKGIFNGAKNAVKSLMTPKGLLMAGAGLAACIAFPVAAPLVLGGIAVAAGGSQMFKAAKNHDAEGMGEGFFTAGSGAAGIWGSGAISAARAGSAGSAGGAAAEGSTSTTAGSAGSAGGAAAEGSTSTAAGGTGAAAEGAQTGGFMNALKNPISTVKGWFSSNPKPAPAAEPPVSVPPAPQIQTQNAPATGPRTIPGTPAPVETAPAGGTPSTIPGTPAPVGNAATTEASGTIPGTPAPVGNTTTGGTPSTIPGTPAPVGNTTTGGAPGTIPGTPAPVGNATTGGAPGTIPGTPAPVETATAEGTAAATKPAMFQGARNNITGTWNYVRGNNLPEGAATNPFSRTGEVFMGKAPGLEVGKPVWSLPSTAAISGNGISQEQLAG